MIRNSARGWGCVGTLIGLACATGGEAADVGATGDSRPIRTSESDDGTTAIEDDTDTTEAALECDAFAEQGACIHGGCRWQPLFGVMIGDDGACATGPEWGLCYPDELAQSCDAGARLCNGTFVWVLPGPDDAVVIARSDTSCDLPEHFMPCPTLTPADALIGAAAASSDGANQAIVNDTVARGCACACADHG